MTLYSTTVARRFKSDVSTTFLTLGKQQANVKKNWLSDPATYPLLAALGTAVAMCTGVGLSCLAYSPDVRIASHKKNSTLRDWSM